MLRSQGEGPGPQNPAEPNTQVAGSQTLGVTLDSWSISVHLSCTLPLLTTPSPNLNSQR